MAWNWFPRTHYFPLEWTVKIIDSVISPRPIDQFLAQFPGLFYLTAPNGGKQANKATINNPSKNIDFGVLMGHVQQLPWTGLIQWGNDGTYILIRYFAIFHGFSPNFIIFPSYLEKRRLPIIEVIYRWIIFVKFLSDSTPFLQNTSGMDDCFWY